jgi:hypothetical protein
MLLTFLPVSGAAFATAFGSFAVVEILPKW